jgi:hypothetical protein
MSGFDTEEITRMARESGFVGFDGNNKCLREFANLVAAAEREACAKVCERGDPLVKPAMTQHQCATAIRARGNNAA